MVLGFFFLAAWALEIKAADRLFLSADQNLAVLEGNPVVLVFKGRRIEARRVVYDRARRRLILSGGVRYSDAEGRLIEAESLVLDLKGEDLEAFSVHLRQGKLDFFAPEACRVLGQVKLPDAFFTPCLACGQKTPDYAFRAEKVVLYPGDRIVAYGVRVEVGGEVVAWLPLLLLYTGPRRPRVSLGLDETDGFWVRADLPYVGLGGAGFTLLRYFERRGWGVGFDHWDAGPARAHYTLLYLPPPVGEAEGTLALKVDYSLRSGAFLRTLKIERDDARVRGRFGVRLGVEKKTRDDPYLRMTLDADLDTDPSAPAPRRTFKWPELELAFRRGLRQRDFSLNGRAVLGGYEAASNPLNRSARLTGPRIRAGRALLEHHERYAPRLPAPLYFSVRNDFVGYYYDTAERQVDWRTGAGLGFRAAPWRAGVNFSRSVREGESPFVFDRLPTRRTAELRPFLEVSEKGLTLKAQSGWAFYKRKPLPLVLEAVARGEGFSLQGSYRRSLETGQPEKLNFSLSLTPRPLSFSAQGGYDYRETRYLPLALKAGYALVGGSLGASLSYDPNRAQVRFVEGRFDRQEGAKNLGYTLRWDNLGQRLSGRVGLGQGRFSLRGRFDYPWPGQGPEGGRLSADLALGWDRWKLGLTTRALGGRFLKAEARLAAGEQRLDRRWNAEMTLHLPDEEDPGAFLRRLGFRGGLELTPWLALQGRLGYARSGEQETLGFYDFGVTLALPRRPSTRVFLSFFLNQRFDLHSGESADLRPKIVFTYDRCCWGLRFTIDSLKEEVRLSWVYGGKGADMVFADEGILLPGGVRLP